MGIGPADPDVNPFHRAELPTLRGLLGQIPTLGEPRPEGANGFAVPLDARLGVAGHPQSGTGQTALLTGHNAPEIFGRHFGPWTPVRLRPLLAEHNVLKQARGDGFSVAFANAYPRGFAETVQSRRLAAVVLAALSVDELNRHNEALTDGRAVASGIVNDGWRRGLGFAGVPSVTPRQAGANLAGISAQAELTVYAHYDTDHAGHDGSPSASVLALERVDQFLGGLLDGIPSDTVLVVASDHGNIEELTGNHTLNPVLGIVASGAGTSALPRGLEAVTDVCPYILSLLATPA